MIEAIFFAFRDVTKGPRLLHQVPPNSINWGDNDQSSEPSQTLFAFSEVADQIIPVASQEEIHSSHFIIGDSNKLRYRILSYPVVLTGAQYPGNAFIFNFCLVLAESTDYRIYLPVVNKLASLFRALERSDKFLSSEVRQHGRNRGRIFAICEILLEDLNNYSECMIPIDGTTSTLNIKLFPIYPTPAVPLASHVPLLTVDLDGMVDESWDLTMCRILPYIDGVNSIKRIAMITDTDCNLALEAVRHLLYYNCAILLDIFSFSAIYIATSKLFDFLTSAEEIQECEEYIALPLLAKDPNFGMKKSSIKSTSPTAKTEFEFRLADLYSDFQQEMTTRDWVLLHPGITQKIDVRRFITFGVIKGFLKRIHKYAELVDHQQQSKGDSNDTDAAMLKFLDGKHTFDEMCTHLTCNEEGLAEKLSHLGDAVRISRR